MTCGYGTLGLHTKHGIYVPPAYRGSPPGGLPLRQPVYSIATPPLPSPPPLFPPLPLPSCALLPPPYLLPKLRRLALPRLPFFTSLPPLPPPSLLLLLLVLVDKDPISSAKTATDQPTHFFPAPPFLSPLPQNLLLLSGPLGTPTSSTRPLSLITSSLHTHSFLPSSHHTPSTHPLSVPRHRSSPTCPLLPPPPTATKQLTVGATSFSPSAVNSLSILRHMFSSRAKPPPPPLPPPKSLRW